MPYVDGFVLPAPKKTFSFERASLGADRAKDSQCSIIAASNPTSVNTAPK